MLEKDGLITVNSSGGVNVIDPHIDDYMYLFEYRKEVEAAAAYYAAQRSTEQHLQTMKKHLETMSDVEANSYKVIHQSAVEFHSSIAEASANPFLISTLAQLQGINTFYRRAILDHSYLYVKKAVEEHDQIYLSIKTRNKEKAKQLMRQHIENDYERFLKLLN